MKTSAKPSRILKPMWKRKDGFPNRKWQQAYLVYLSSPEWFYKRQRVLDRADGICEACGVLRATQVHHHRYPQGCLPGSEKWLAQEKLFDLAAICEPCHQDLHRS